MLKQIILIVTGLLLLSCVTVKVKPVIVEMRPNPMLVDFNQVNDFAKLTSGDIPMATDYILELADKKLDKILQFSKDDRSFKNTIIAIDDIYAVIGRIEYPIYLMSAVHPDKTIRSEADTAIIKMSKWQTDFSLNDDLFMAVEDFSKSDEANNLKGVEKRYFDDVYNGFLRQGFGLSKEKRDEVKAIRNRMSQLGLEFDNNITNYTDTLLVDEKAMTGLPESYKKAYSAGDGQYKIDISYPSRRVFMKLSQSEEARKALSEKFLNRGAEKNLKVIPVMVSEYHNLAQVLGYRSYAEYLLEDRMPLTPERVWQFEKDVFEALQDKIALEDQELLDMKTRMTGEEAHEINYWELHYYQNLVFEEKYSLNENEIRKYFELNNVRDGLFTISQTLYGLEFKQVENPSTWHSDVTMYEAYDNNTGNLLGYFYFDLFPRENKYNHAAHFGISKGWRTVKGYQKPIASLVCNFPKPTEDQPSLLSHDEVNTFFHEFGHLLHGMVTTADYFSYSGTGVDRDFVEAPSQIFENWVWNIESLKLFAKHYETGEIIPDDLVNKMLAAKNMSSGGDFAFQVFLGSLDMTLFDLWNKDSEETVLDVAQRLHKEILSWNETPGTARIASFGHLNGYSASYYGYAWSKVFAEDMFSVFSKEGLMNPVVGQRFRNVVLAPGGSKEPLDIVKEFLGREPNNEAFKRSLGL